MVDCSTIAKRTYGQFFGVYLLFSLNPATKKKTYIGFTVDPAKRLKQHNAGSDHGGAKKTNNRGPWTMVLIVHGFPNEITALRFEWAWQNPLSSRRLRHVVKKKSPSERCLEFDLRVLSCMLTVPPWNRLSLNIKWLSGNDLPGVNEENIKDHRLFLEDYEMDYSIIAPSPNVNTTCVICGNTRSNVSETFFKCTNRSCSGSFHVSCLAHNFTAGTDEIIPISGFCPVCDKTIIWCDIVSLNE